MVVTSLPSTDQIGRSQDAIGRPSSSTKHAPHWPLPQPKRLPTRPRSLRNTYRSGVSPCTSMLCRAPLTTRSSMAQKSQRVVALDGAQIAGGEAVVGDAGDLIDGAPERIVGAEHDLRHR